jgi:hypothetical protein
MNGADFSLSAVLLLTACGGSQSTPQPTADAAVSSDASVAAHDSSARPDSEAVGDSAAGDGNPGSPDSAPSDSGSQGDACGALSGCVSPNSCVCTGRVQVTPAQACQMLEQRLEVNGFIGPDTAGSACDAACGSGDACYVSPDYVQHAQDANGNSLGPFDAGSFVCPPVSCSVTVGCAPSSC